MRIGVMVVIATLSSATALGQVSVWPMSSGGNGNAYELVSDSLYWDEAKLASSARTPPTGFLPGTLVTISSAAENAFVNQLRGTSLPWIGFTDEAVEGEWRWIDDTPGIWQDPKYFSTPIQTAYVNWSSGEPNNWGGDEDYAMFWGDTWNDGQYRGAKFPYVVEYRSSSEPLPSKTAPATTAWTTWSSNTQGAIATPYGNIGVTYAGELKGFDYPSWSPTSSYADGLYVATAPPASSPAVRLYGGDNSVRTITFSEPVQNPVVAIWSLGNAGAQARFVFDQLPTLICGGASVEYAGTALSVSGNTVSGVEANGTIMFPGTYSRLSWTNPNYEFRYGFTVGIPGMAAIDVAEGSLTQEQAGYALVSGPANIEKTGAGALILDRVNTLTGNMVVRSGVVQIAHASALRDGGLTPLAGGTVTLMAKVHATVGRLLPGAGGVIDVGAGRITVQSGLSASALTAAIIAGRTTGTSGIISSTANLTPGIRTVGWLDNGDGSMTFGYAAPGDGTLDGSVDILDVAFLLASRKYNRGLPATWIEGDYNYDGFVDLLDIVDLLSTGLYNTGLYDTAVGGISVVPEPSTCIFLSSGLLFICFGMRRHKRFRGTGTPDMVLMLAFAVCPAYCSAQNLLHNGSFEIPVASTGIISITGSTAPSGFDWSVAGGSVEVTRQNYVGGTFGDLPFLGAAADGSQWLDLDGEEVKGGPGTISQAFNTVVGYVYALTFSYSSNPYRTYDGPATATVSVVDAGSQAVLVSPFQISHGSSTATDFDWRQAPTSTFVAASGSTVLRFASNNPATSDAGVLLDAISVSAVPEPTTSATLAAGLAIGWIALRRSA